MSDNSTTIVDIEVTKKGAKAAAARAVEYLAGRGIIQKRASKCVMGMGDKGYAPGPKYAAACVRPFPALSELAVNGLEVCARREVFLAFENGLEIACPKCRHKIMDPDDAWMDAVEVWHGGDDEAAYACPKCKKKQRLALWDGPFPWGFGNLGLTFWNWPDLKPAVVKEVAKVLGHEVRVVRAHM